MLIPALKNRQGNCELHGNCVESYCSNVAMSKELNLKPSDLPALSDEDPIFESVSDALAYLCVNICLLVSPQKIIIGGGVMNRKIMYGMV